MSRLPDLHTRTTGGKQHVSRFADSKTDLQRAAESSADYVLLDQGSGGTGKTFDWSLAEGFTRPFLLAGGLGTDNLAEAIERLSPWAVDLSSSLEIGGLKDRDKIIEAVNIVRSFEQLK